MPSCRKNTINLDQKFVPIYLSCWIKILKIQRSSMKNSGEEFCSSKSLSFTQLLQKMC